MPGPGARQTSATVFDIGGGLDILVNPCNHETPALHLLLNQAKGQ